MTTTTKTFTETNTSLPRKSWTIALTGTNQTVSGNFTLATPTATAKTTLVSSVSGYTPQNIGGGLINMRFSVGGSLRFQRGYYEDATFVPGTTYTMSAENQSLSITLSNVFNANNKEDITASVIAYSDAYDIGLGSAVYQPSLGYYYRNDYSNGSTYTWGTIATLTLNAPPTISNVTSTYATPHYTGLGEYSVSIGQAKAKYGGDIVAIKLTVGADSEIKNYSSSSVSSQTISLIPSQAGTFTPTITVTDSRGQTRTETLSSITVEEVPPPTFTTSDITTNTGYDYINHGVTTASIVISNIDSLYDTPTRATFGIGSQAVSGNLNGEDHITLSINIDQPALSNQSVWVRVYDSNNRYRQENKTSVHINEYTYPSANVRDIYRVNDRTKEPDDEGTYAVLKLMLSRDRYSTYIKFMQPTVLIDGNTPQNTILWYSDESLTQQITWPYIEPIVGAGISAYYPGTCTIYGVLSEFEIDKTYSISIAPNDNYYSGNTITTTLPQAFFTLDVLAGGHGIAFGRSAKKEYFDIYMPTSINGGIAFNNGVFIDVNQNEALYTLLDSNKLLSKLQVPNVEIVMSDNWSVGSDQSVVFTITYNNYLHDFEYQPNDFNIIFEELERPNDISIRDMWIDNSVGDNIWLIQKHIYETNGYYNDGVISFKVIYKYKGMTLFEETYSKQLILH